jgi:hypothetical protein
MLENKYIIQLCTYHLLKGLPYHCILYWNVPLTPRSRIILNTTVVTQLVNNLPPPFMETEELATSPIPEAN